MRRAGTPDPGSATSSTAATPPSCGHARTTTTRQGFGSTSASIRPGVSVCINVSFDRDRGYARQTLHHEAMQPPLSMT
jgi:hypothetical protein